MASTDGSRLIVKNLPLTLDNKTLRKIFTENASKLGLQITDCQLLHKDPKINPKKLVKNAKPLKVFENGKVSKGICFVGFINPKYAKKFKEYYNGTYVRSCKITVDFAKPPAEQSNSNEHKSHDGIKSRKAGVASVRVKKIFNDEGQEDEIIHSNLDHSQATIDTTADEKNGNVTNYIINNHDIQTFKRVILFNLPYNVSEDELRKLVKNFGPVTQIHIPSARISDDKINNLTRGFAYITFLFDTDAGRFLQEKDKTIFCGRLLSILPAKDNNKSILKESDVGYVAIKKRDSLEKGYKTELKERLKEDAENQDIWNTLYIDINTAIQAVSDEMGISRENLLRNSEKHSVAVTAASSETAVIAKLKSWLNEQGIDIECFERSQIRASKKHDDFNGDDKTMRSSNTIIIKNLSLNSDEDELREMFNKRGQLMRFSISPYKNMAIVQYLNCEDAKKAFFSLAYKNYLGMPMFLEWAPTSLYKESASKIDSKAEDCARASDDDEMSDALDDALANGFHKSIYIKNLNFNTSSERLNEFMSVCDGLVSCKVITRYDKIKNKTLSMGFAFAEFITLDKAQQAIKLLSGKLLDGHLLEFSLADNSQKGEKAKKRKRVSSKVNASNACNKLSVKNLAFQATKSELRKLFSLYGNVRNVRIPKSISNSNRGFAFVEFENKTDAVNALEALQHTHFYGRHLILDFAQASLLDPGEQDLAEGILDGIKGNKE